MPQLNASLTDNIRFAEQGSNPSTPAAGFWRLFFKATGLYIMEDTGTVYPVQTLRRELFLSAYQGWPSTTNGCAPIAKTEYVTNDVDLQSLDFDQTLQEHAQWTVWMPSDWNAGTISFQVVWTAAAGTVAQTVEWNLQGRAYANDDAIDQAWGTAVEVSDALIATGDMHYSPESAAVTIAGTPASGELVQFRVFRDIADTLAADAKLLGVKIFYT